MSNIKISQVRSAIGTKPKHRKTLRALGLGRIGKIKELPDRPEIRGMIRSVEHLVIVEDVTAKKEAKKPAEKEAAASTAKKPAAKKPTETKPKTTAKKPATKKPAAEKEEK